MVDSVVRDPVLESECTVRGKRRQGTHLLLKLRRGVTWTVPAGGHLRQHCSQGRQGVDEGSVPGEEAALDTSGQGQGRDVGGEGGPRRHCLSFFSPVPGVLRCSAAVGD